MLLIAEAGDVAGWASVLASVANIGFAGLVGWYLLTKALPKLQEDFKDELNSQRKDFKDELKTQRDDTTRRDEQRKVESREALQLVIKHCEVENERHMNIIKGEVAGFGKVVQDNREVMEEVRDALREFKESIKDLMRGRT